MGYADKLQKLCILRNVDQVALASLLGVSKSTISRVMSGLQEPKLSMAGRLARALGVTLDYLVDESMELDATHQVVVVSEEELMILKLVRRLGANIAIDRLLDIHGSSSGEGKARAGPVPVRLEEAQGSTMGK